MNLSLHKNGGNDSLAVGFGPQRIEFALVRRGNGAKASVRACASVAFEVSALDALRELRKRLSAGRADCIALLPADEYQLHVVDAPNVPDAEMRDAVRWRMKDMLDFPVEEATVDVAQVPVDANAPARTRSLFAVSARNAQIGACMKLFREARMRLRVIDVAEMAQRNIASLFEDGPRAIALLCFRDDHGLLTFSARGELCLTRRIDVGMDQIMQSAGDARAQLFDRIALELQRSLDHFDRQFGHLPLGRFLLGPLPEEVGLTDYLSRNLSMSAETLDLDSVLDFEHAPGLRAAAAQARVLHVLGAALRDESP